MVATNGEESEVCQIRSSVPQGGIWSTMLFDLFIQRRLPEEARHAAKLCHADDVTLVMRIPTGERETSAVLLNLDIERILKFGKNWLLKFEAKKTKAITISKKRYVVNVPLVMEEEVICENETLDVLGFTLDSKGTWSPLVDRMAAR